MAVEKKSVVKKSAPKKAAPKKANAGKAAPAKSATQKEVSGELMPTASATNNVPVIHDDETRLIAQRVMAIHEETKWEMPVARGKPLSGQELDAWLNKKEDQAAIGLVELGIGYLLKKREIGHGAFMAWVKESAGTSQSSVNEKMKVASMVIHLSEENSRRAVNLPQRKLAALASAPIPLINDLFNSGALDHAADLSREQLRELISLRKEVEKQEEREEKLNKVIAAQDEELRKRRALPESNRHALELRRAVLDETEALRANTHTLQSVMDKVAILPTDLGRAELDAIIHPLMYALQGLHATVTALHERGHRQFGYHTDIDVLPPQLSAEELARASVQHSGFMEAAERRAIDRQLDLSVKSKGRK